MDINASILGLIGAITGLLALYRQLHQEKFILEISTKVIPFIWCTDYAVNMDSLSTAQSKWIRMINMSALPVTIYEIEIIASNELTLTSNAAITSGEPFDFHSPGLRNAKHSYYFPSVEDEQNSPTEPLVYSDAKLPLVLKPYEAFEGYIFFRGLGDDILPEGNITMIFHTSRKDKVIESVINYTEGDI